jgi:hypothetical protein
MGHACGVALAIALLVLAGGCSSGGAAGSGTGGATGSGGASAAHADSAAPKPAGIPRLFYLDILGGRVLSAAPDGTDPKVLVPSGTLGGPDGIAVDVAHGHIYWTNMGVPSGDDGSVQRSNLDGSEVTTVVAQGDTFTPKQLKLDAKNGKLYWSDREGMAVMRSNLDGSGLETLVTIAEGDAARANESNWGVGIALDLEGKHVYWTQKGPTDGGKGSIRRAGLEIPAGKDSKTRSDIEILFDKLMEPIDLDLDLEHHLLYWTDRGDNTVSRAPMDPPAGVAPDARTDRKILVTGLGEAIGVSLDLAGGAMYYTALDGKVGTSALDGAGAHDLLTGQGSLTGITYVELPK